MRLLRYASVLFVFQFFIATVSSGQAVVIPAQHPVYEWLHSQRVAGIVPSYNHESLPHTRNSVNRWLHQVLESEKSGREAKKLAKDFLGEFDLQPVTGNALYKSLKNKQLREVPEALLKRPEPYLYSSVTKDSSLFGAFYVARATGNFVNLDGSGRYLLFNYRAAKFFVANRSRFGVFFQADNPGFYGTNREYASLHPQWGQSGTFQHDPDSWNSYSYETMISADWKYLQLDFGRGALSMGASLTDGLVVRRNAPLFTWSRVKLGTDQLQFYQVVGSLYSEPVFDRDIIAGDTVLFKRKTPRWLNIHGLRVQPAPWISLNVFESIIYARPLDADYTNPFVPYYFTQVDKGDMDNAMLGIETVIRPFRGLELFGSLVIDDLPSLSKIVKLDSTKMVFTVGGSGNLPGNVIAGFAYTRSDANTYSHWLKLNTYENRGESIGHRLGPNAEEYVYQIARWFPYRTRLQIRYKYLKKGLNPVDVNGVIIENVGGDLLNGVGSLSQKLYQGADLQRWTEAEAEFMTEPLRGVFFSYRISKTKPLEGTRVDAFTYSHIVVRVGF